MQKPSGQWSLAVLVLVTLAIRGAALAAFWQNFLDEDPDSYARLAINWASSGVFGFESREPSAAPTPPADSHAAQLPSDDGQPARVQPTAYRPPFYPWLLSWLVVDGRLEKLAVAGLHLALGLATVLLVYFLAVQLDIRWPWLPALAVACDPILLRGSQLVMTETVITFFAVVIWSVSLVCFTPCSADDHAATSHRGFNRRAAAAVVLGGLLGLAVLTRPTMLPWAIAISLILLRPREGSLIQRASLFALTTLVLVAAISPWIARNAQQLGRPIWATTHGGYTLLLANNPLLYRHIQRHGFSRDWDARDFHWHWALRRDGDPTEEAFWLQPIEQAPPDIPIKEMADDRLAQAAAKATIRREPMTFARSCLVRLSWLWAVAPNEGSVRVKVAVGLWYSATFLLALLGAWRLGRQWWQSPWLVAATLLVTLSGIHSIYWSNMRMRAPLMPVVAIVAAASLRPRSTSADN